MRKIFWLPLTLILASQANSETLVDIQSPEFDEAVRNYIMENPEVLFEAADQYRIEQEQLAQLEAQKAVSDFLPTLTDESGAVILGDPDAPIEIVEFSDYNCGFCRKAHEEIKTILANNSDVKVIIRQFPIVSQGSFEGAQHVLAIKNLFGHEKAQEFHNAAFEFGAQMSTANAMEIANSMGLDMAQIESEINSENVLAEIDAMRAIASRLQINGTPAFVIGDQIVGGLILEDIEAAIEQQRVELSS